MSKILTSDDLGEVIKVLRNEVVDEWMNVGFALNLKYSDLKPLRQDCNTQRDRQTRMLNLWLKEAYSTTKYGSPTWKSLADAIEIQTGGNNRALAKKIRAEKILPLERSVMF